MSKFYYSGFCKSLHVNGLRISEIFFDTGISRGREDFTMVSSRIGYKVKLCCPVYLSQVSVHYGVDRSSDSLRQHIPFLFHELRGTALHQRRKEEEERSCKTKSETQKT